MTRLSPLSSPAVLGVCLPPARPQGAFKASSPPAGVERERLGRPRVSSQLFYTSVCQNHFLSIPAVGLRCWSKREGRRVGSALSPSVACALLFCPFAVPSYRAFALWVCFLTPCPGRPDSPFSDVSLYLSSSSDRLGRGPLTPSLLGDARSAALGRVLYPAFSGKRGVGRGLSSRRGWRL